MTKLAELVKRVEVYAKRANISENTASRHVFNDGKRLNALRGKSRMWPDTIEAALKKVDALEAALNGAGESERDAAA